jgi:glycosyltransferase involved in cell wall biosynthesis
MYANIKQAAGVDFVVFWNNRNIRRKQPGDVILAFKTFVDGLPESQKSKVALLMHTQVVDGNGTDLRAIWKTLAPDCKILFSESKLSTEELNAMYNVADVVVNIASNEGWGLSSTEAILAGTPVIVSEDSLAYEMGASKIADINHLPKPDRSQWLIELAHKEWFPNELGQAWRGLRARLLP